MKETNFIWIIETGDLRPFRNELYINDPRHRVPYSKLADELSFQAGMHSNDGS